MTDFDTAMTTAVTDLLGPFGETLTHTAADGTQTAFTGSFAEDPPAASDGTDGTTRTRSARLTCLASALADPKADETITRGSEIWTIRDRTPLAGGAAWDLELTRSESREKARQAYRLRR